ncbi:MAG: S46 family peptidase [Melioribacteraceae bacterium]|nr:S46 family peptidase [Melioribacteraceae bacterium]
MNNQNKSFLLILVLVSSSYLFGQSSFYNPMNIDTVKWSFDDLGKMWTFDNVPVNTFEQKYNFKPEQNWLDDVQKSALQFGGGCSGAFVSADGLIMTNHHCGRNELHTVEQEGENLLKDGFYAESLKNERKIENLYVDQLILIEDVTNEIKSYMRDGISDDDKIRLRNKMKDSLTIKYEEETGLKCRIVTLYHGGKYSLYGYKRYNDIRLVMAPDFQIAATGWDWDNFTYPRYELDFMFYRAYDEEGNPVKTDHYFSWSKKGAEDGEPIFVVGRPGSTDRLYSIEQLEYFKNYTFPFSLKGFNAIYDAYYEEYQKFPESDELLNRVMGWGNSRKSYAGRLAGLNNEYIMKKKKDFQKDLISKVNSDPEIKEKYGHVWKSIETVINELSQYSVQNTINRFSRFIKPVYYKMAEQMIYIAEQKKLPNDDREDDYKDENLEVLIDKIYPKEIESDLEDNILAASVKFINSLVNSDHYLIKNVFDSKQGKEAVKSLKSKSNLLTKEGYLKIAQMDADEILGLDDPFIKYILFIKEESKRINPKVGELNNTLSVLNELLGEVVYSVFGNRIPPDATSTLRISDGVIKGYEYNGTIAPGKTTYYGLWDRYESFNKKTYPWGLHERWKTPPSELDLSTDIGFASTNDIVGGNSGSSVININKEVVGLVHDGNIESLAGHTIFLEENNRTVATDSDGLLQALIHVYKTDNLVKELLNGKINN